MHPLVRNYIVIGAACGITLDMTLTKSDSLVVTQIFIFIVPLLYALFIYLLFGTNLNNSLYKIQEMTLKMSNFKNTVIPIIPNILSMLLLGAIIGNTIYETYEATILAMLLTLIWGVIIKFKFNYVVSALVWGTLGVLAGQGYADSDDIHRLQNYGVLGAIIGIVFSVIAGAIVGALQGMGIFLEKDLVSDYFE